MPKVLNMGVDSWVQTGIFSHFRVRMACARTDRRMAPQHILLEEHETTVSTVKNSAQTAARVFEPQFN
jgi:hypothetical protein